MDLVGFQALLRLGDAMSDRCCPLLDASFSPDNGARVPVFPLVKITMDSDTEAFLPWAGLLPTVCARGNNVEEKCVRAETPGNWATPVQVVVTSNGAVGVRRPGSGPRPAVSAFCFRELGTTDVLPDVVPDQVCTTDLARVRTSFSCTPPRSPAHAADVLCSPCPLAAMFWWCSDWLAIGDVALACVHGAVELPVSSGQFLNEPNSLAECFAAMGSWYLALLWSACARDASDASRCMRQFCASQGLGPCDGPPPGSVLDLMGRLCAHDDGTPMFRCSCRRCIPFRP